MNITDEIAHIEGRLRDAENKWEHERRRSDHLAGALRQCQAHSAELIKELGEARKLNGIYETHFHTFHGSAEHIKKQEQVIAAAEKPQTPAPPEVPNTILGKLTRLGLKTEVAA